MSYIKADNDKEQEYFDFLEDLRKSGQTNMFGAGPYLASAFGLSREESRVTLSRWMNFHDDPKRKLDAASTPVKTEVEFETRAKIKSKARQAHEQY